MVNPPLPAVRPFAQQSTYAEEFWECSDGDLDVARARVALLAWCSQFLSDCVLTPRSWAIDGIDLPLLRTNATASARNSAVYLTCEPCMETPFLGRITPNDWVSTKTGQPQFCYHLLRDAAPYRDIGGNYFDERQRLHTLRRAVQRSERLGYKVSRDAA